jgi:hypothetical protein
MPAARDRQSTIHMAMEFDITCKPDIANMVANMDSMKMEHV